MNLTNEELNYMINAIDTHVRSNGIKGASIAVCVANKLQAEAHAQLPTQTQGTQGIQVPSNVPYDTTKRSES